MYLTRKHAFYRGNEGREEKNEEKEEKEEEKKRKNILRALPLSLTAPANSTPSPLPPPPGLKLFLNCNNLPGTVLKCKLREIVEVAVFVLLSLIAIIVVNYYYIYFCF